MAFGYEFVTLNQEQKHARRVLLEYYPKIAQVSVLLVVALFQLTFFISWFAKRGQSEPGSPSLSKAKEKWGFLKGFRRGLTSMKWWLKKPLISAWDCGSRGDWAFGSIWTLWLLTLCLLQTGNDYLHLTKRFGIIGASQLPFHYLLAMRSPYSPVQYLTRMSHEELKASHGVLGRIIYFLFALHVIFYMIFFVLSGFLAKRIKDRDVIFGIISFVLFSVMSTTALGKLRNWNYRVFYNTHVFIANLIIISLFLHVSHIRIYIYQVILVNAIHQILRNFSFTIYSGSIKVLPGTNLVQLRIPLPPTDSAVKWKPGQHVYLSRPAGYSNADSAYDNLLMRNKQNPFTVASLPSVDKELLLVARTLNGNTKDLADLARKVATEEIPEISLAVEGPYGSSKRLPDFSSFDKILLVAGGVGATFMVPIYRSLVSDTGFGIASSKIRFIWTVRTLGETQWAFPLSCEREEDGSPQGLHSHGSNIEVFVTRTSGSNLNARTSASGDDIELAENEQLLSLEEQIEKPPRGMSIQAGRPNLPAVVDEVFRKGHRVAVFCCGPKSLTERLSQSVERWDRKGYDVYWHDESFAW
ncbi:ferric reductase NAD binding domain-containing protein [Dendryphion nanum]|uniref:Ferric reductase NAD binding domain-containing protein n=1 Tax=Dendryphion nanum TaxID=256645 RepID=A0A9P9EC87_9PLEO|nr:ferric reductase NAD binding domain-containing protein [Dendryphion nanum]